jgi:hypothetical protein
LKLRLPYSHAAGWGEISAAEILVRDPRGGNSDGTSNILKRTTRITVETRRVVVIGGGGPMWRWCTTCDHEVRMLTPEVASAVANVKTREIYQWVERGLVHFSEAADGLVLICTASLLEHRRPMRQP